jgi:acyl-coenzyme A synthetase/AMP-(fatty) acid ligase
MGAAHKGEALDAQLRDEIVATGVTLINSYGPAECADVAVADLITSTQDEVSLGMALDNVDVYLLDEQLQPVASGTVGEIFIGGVGVGRGYLHRPDLTAERFVPDPFAAPGARMYRTGDRGRADKMGRIAFLGRSDDQVKIRGMRVELGEVESTLMQMPIVGSAAVVAVTDKTGEAAIVAWVVLKDGCTSELAAIRDHLNARLPQAMVPRVIELVAQLPLNPNGKIDRVALKARGLPEVAPTTPARQSPTILDEVLSLMVQVMQGQHFEADTDFFNVGLHSARLMRLVALCRIRFSVRVTMLDVTMAATPGGLAALIERQLATALPVTSYP